MTVVQIIGGMEILARFAQWWIWIVLHAITQLANHALL